MKYDPSICCQIKYIHIGAGLLMEIDIYNPVLILHVF